MPTIYHLLPIADTDGTFGGPTSVCHAQIHEMKARGVAVKVIAPSARPVEVAPEDYKVFKAVEFLPKHACTLSPRMLFWLFSTLRKGDVLHVHAGRHIGALLALVVASFRTPSVFLQTHGMYVKHKNLLIRLFDAVAIPVLRAVVAQIVVLNRDERQAVLELFGPIPIATVPNGVPERPSLPRIERTREVVFVGRLHRRKRPAIFIEAARSLTERYPDFLWTLYGPDGGELAKVHDLLASFPSDRIKYCGNAAREDVLTILGSTYIFVLPSVDEPFPMTLLEAMSCGTPTLTTLSCHIGDQLSEDEASILFPDDDVSTLIKELDQILRNVEEWERLSINGARSISARFSISSAVDVLMTLYSSRQSHLSPGEGEL